MWQIAFHNTVIILNDPRMMFLLQKYWSHCFLLRMPTRFLQSHTHTHTHTHTFTHQMTKLLSGHVESIYITISIT